MWKKTEKKRIQANNEEQRGKAQKVKNIRKDEKLLKQKRIRANYLQEEEAQSWASARTGAREQRILANEQNRIDEERAEKIEEYIRNYLK